jgi:hypothetical protein
MVADTVGGYWQGVGRLRDGLIGLYGPWWRAACIDSLMSLGTSGWGSSLSGSGKGIDLFRGLRGVPLTPGYYL